MAATAVRGVASILLLVGAIGLVAFWGLAVTGGAILAIALAAGVLAGMGLILHGESIHGGTAAITIGILGYYLYPYAGGLPTGLLGSIGLLVAGGAIGIALYYYD